MRTASTVCARVGGRVYGDVRRPSFFAFFGVCLGVKCGGRGCVTVRCVEWWLCGIVVWWYMLWWCGSMWCVVCGL